MGLKLKKPDVWHYNTGDRVEFYVTLYDIFDKYKAVINAPQLLAVFWEKVQQEEWGFNWVRRNEFTEKKAAADRKRGLAFMGLFGTLRGLVKHFDPKTRDYAKHVMFLVRNYGYLAQGDYDETSANIESLVERLGSEEYRAAVQALQLEGWVAELGRLNEVFRGYASDAMGEIARKPEIAPAAARRETNVAFRAVADRIGALMVIQGEGAFEGLVRAYNVHVQQYNVLVHEHYGRLRAGKLKESEELRGKS
jgi:hypothetical protein